MGGRGYVTGKLLVSFPNPIRSSFPSSDTHTHTPLFSQVIATARTCNLILIVLDCMKPITHKRLIEHELEGFGLRLNKTPPEITFRKKDKVAPSPTPTPTPSHPSPSPSPRAWNELKK